MRVVAVAGAVLVLAGCAPGGGSADDPGPTRPAAQSTETPAETASETPAATPTGAPVNGPVMEVQGISIRLPKGYDVGFETPVVATAQGRLGLVTLGVIAGEQRSLDRQMKEDLEAYGPMRTVERLPDTTLDGLPAYHYSGRQDRYLVRDVYGTWDGGYQVLVRFELSDHRPEAARRELIESVVATYDSPTD